MGFSDLPDELVLAIVNNIDNDRDISAFSRTNWRVFRATVTPLYRHNHVYNDGTAMEWAIRHEREQTVRRALKTGVPLIKLKHLTMAAEHGRADLFHLLWVAKKDIGGFGQMAEDEDGRSPLLYAARSGQYAMVEKLLMGAGNRHLDVNVRDEFHHTPLYIAANDGNERIVEILLDWGADVMARDKLGRVPLSAAAAPLDDRAHRKGPVVKNERPDYIHTIRHLLRNGAHIEYKEPDGETALHAAAAAGHCDVVELLATEFKADVNTRDGTDRTPLHSASLYLGKLEMTQLLVRLGANPNILNREGQNALSMSREAEEPALVADFLLQKGTKIVFDVQGDTPMHIAGQMRSTGLIDVLLKYGADINTKNMKGLTPLHIAILDAAGGPIIKRFVENGASVEAKNNQGETPLACAIECCSYQTVEYLLRHWADPNSTDKSGKPLLHRAVERDSVELVELLLQRGAKHGMVDSEGQTALQFAATLGDNADIDIMKLLLDCSAEFNISDKKGNTPLMAAITAGSVPMVKLLLKTGASVNVANKKKQTPLHLASLKGSTEIVTILCERWARVDAKDSAKRTPLSLASSKGHAGVVQALVDKGADCTVSDQNGTTPLMLASGRSSREIFEIIVKNGNVEGTKEFGLKGRRTA